jgi:hypothetical protein
LKTLDDKRDRISGVLNGGHGGILKMFLLIENKTFLISLQTNLFDSVFLP